MNLLLYSPEGDRTVQTLLALTDKASGIEICRTLDAFRAHLIKPTDTLRVIVAIADRNVLTRFCEWGDLLEGHCLILLLTEDSAESIRLAHRFRPRYVAFAGDDLEELGSVLERLIQRCEEMGMGRGPDESACSSNPPFNGKGGDFPSNERVDPGRLPGGSEPAGSLLTK